MITKLEQLSMSQFIDLVCGDKSVLHSKHEIIPSDKVERTMRNIVFEYQSIADESGNKQYLGQTKRKLLAKLNVTLFTMCKNLIVVGAYDNAREVLIDYGINAVRMSDQRLEAEVKSRLERARKEKNAIEDDNSILNISDMRKNFDEQTAALMAHFKFQIDATKIKATLYAHLVSLFNREIKAQMAGLKK